MPRHRALFLTLSLILVTALRADAPPASAAAATAASASGRWTGAIELPGGKLAVAVDLQGGAPGSGTISIPAQGAHDLPLGGVTVDGKAVRFAISGVPGEPTFGGTLAADARTIDGTFTQGGASFPFHLERAATPAQQAGDRLSGIDGWIADNLKAWDVPGVAVAIVADGKVAMTRGFGRRDVAHELPMSEHTLLPIGSCTKAFTTFLLGTLVDEGKLAWDEPVRRYLPGFALQDEYASAHATARDLVTHRIGLPRHDLVWYNNQDLTREELVERLRFLAPNKQLRETFQYNNLAFLAAGRLAEVLTGTTWEEAMRQRVLAPLGMTHTFFRDADAEQTPDFALPYELEHDALRQVPFREVGNMGPAGSITSSAEDMARWLLVQLDGGTIDGRQVLQPATLLELHTPQMAIAAPAEKPEVSTTAYAMGWFVDAYRGHNRLSHGGNIDGFSAAVTLLPDDRIGVVVLANADGTGFPEVLTNYLVDRLLALQPIDWNAEALAKRAAARAAQGAAAQRKAAVRVTGTRPAHALADYAGDYWNPGYGIVHVDVDGKSLRATYNHIATPLEHWHYETWNGGRNESDPAFEDMKYTFTTDVNGDVAALAVPFEPLLPAIPFTRQPDPWMREPARLQALAGVYDVSGQEMTIALRGNELTAFLRGQPLYTLAPSLGGWFELEGLHGFRLRFRGDTIELQQPNGLFLAQRKR